LRTYCIRAVINYVPTYSVHNSEKLADVLHSGRGEHCVPDPAGQAVARHDRAEHEPVTIHWIKLQLCLRTRKLALLL